MEQREVDNMLLSMIQKHFPSLPLSDEYTDWGKWLGFARAVYESGRASPASVPEGWKHSCNALCLDGVELWVPQCPHCGKPAPTPPVSEDRWLPIETAPKDGIEVWCFNGEHCVMRWISGEGYALWVYVDPLRSDADPEPEQPSHWMPLPEAPTMQEDKQ